MPNFHHIAGLKQKLNAGTHSPGLSDVDDVHTVGSSFVEVGVHVNLYRHPELIRNRPSKQSFRFQNNRTCKFLEPMWHCAARSISMSWVVALKMLFSIHQLQLLVVMSSNSSRDGRKRDIRRQVVGRHAGLIDLAKLVNLPKGWAGSSR